MLHVQPVTRAVGGVMSGVDLGRPLTDDASAFVRASLFDRGVLVFRDQDVTKDQLHAFASNLGTPIPEPFRPADRETQVVGDVVSIAPKGTTDVWHHDTTFMTEPPRFTVLRAVRLPEVGGDTLWASMYAAYDALSDPMRAMLDGLTALHSMIPVLQRMPPDRYSGYHEYASQTHGVENVHPVVLVHPGTGRKALYVNKGWTTRICELSPAESDRVLELLFEHVMSPDFNMRWRWSENDVVVWDNWAVQHYAVADYDTERAMHRIVVAGTRPVGPR
jgi:taurine dioxygenase